MPDRYCVLCGNRNKSDSYYSFPINQESRKKWLDYCGINEQVLNTVTKLCWNHFEKDDIIRIGKSTIVKRNAVPSIIRKKRKVYKCSGLIKNDKDYILKKQESATVRNGTVDGINCNTVDIDNANLGDGTIDDGRVTDNTVHNGAVDDISSNNVDIKNANFDNRTANLGNFEFVSVNDDPTVLLEETCGLVDRLSIPSESIECFQTPVKAVRNLRYVGDIRPEHLATPRKAEFALQLAKQTIANQHRKIKSLQQARNRLIGRLITMKALVKYFKKKSGMMEMTAKNLMVTLPSVTKGPSKRKIGRGK